MNDLNYLMHPAKVSVDWYCFKWSSLLFKNSRDKNRLKTSSKTTTSTYMRSRWVTRSWAPNHGDVYNSTTSENWDHRKFRDFKFRNTCLIQLVPEATLKAWLLGKKRLPRYAIFKWKHSGFGGKFHCHPVVTLRMASKKPYGDWNKAGCFFLWLEAVALFIFFGGSTSIYRGHWWVFFGYRDTM